MRTLPTPPAPHDVAPNSVARVMRMVLFALAPATAMHVVFFGPGLLIQMVLGIGAALLAEALALRLRGQPLRRFLLDGSAVITAVLLAMCLPPLAPWYLVVTGAAFAMLFAKHLYGGLGANPFNPAMVGYAVLLVSFPTELARWPAPDVADLATAQLGLGATLRTILLGHPVTPLTWDAITSPTPLEVMRAGLASGQTMEEIRQHATFGALGGRGWEWINLAILAGGIWLLVLRIIRWHIPVAVLAGIAVPAAIMSAIDPGAFAGPVFHLSTGASMLGAFFVATDPISAATSDRGRLIYGAGIGVITYIIRESGGYADGIAFAVLAMNLAAPLIDRYTIPRVYGHPR